ncbi:hypothetical protein AB6D11_02655 [Vibrio splendidus]
MKIKPKSECFNPNATSLNSAHFNKTPEEKLANKAFKYNRNVICAYLFRIQKRFDRGQHKQAKQLFTQMAVVTQLPRWALIAARDELTIN